MREHGVDVILRKVVKGCSFGQDHSKELVIALDAPLLPRRTGIAVEHAGSQGSVKGVLQRERVGELRAIVRQQTGEETLEQFAASQFP